MRNSDMTQAGAERGISRRGLIGRAAALTGTAVAGPALLPGGAGMGPIAQAIASGVAAVEARPVTLDDLSLTPAAIGSPLSAGFTWGFIDDRITNPGGNPGVGHGNPNGGWGAPSTYLRVYFNAGGSVATLPNSIDQNTVGPLGTPVPLFNGQTYAGPSPYVQVSGPAPEGPSSDPYHWVMSATGADGSSILYRYSSQHARAIEQSPGGAPIMDLTYDFFPYAMLLHGPTGAYFPYFSQQAFIHGTFNGNQVSFLGGTDRLFAATTNFTIPGELFLGLFFSGQHPDGKIEWGFVGWVQQTDGRQRGTGWYVRQKGAGNYEIVTSTQVELLDATWGLQQNTGVPVFTSASWAFADKIIDYQAQWAFLVGQGTRTNTTGVWSERHSSPNFVHSLTFSESHATPSQVGLG
jgi:hypothetical protein